MDTLTVLRNDVDNVLCLGQKLSGLRERSRRLLERARRGLETLTDAEGGGAKALRIAASLLLQGSLPFVEEASDEGAADHLREAVARGPRADFETVEQPLGDGWWRRSGWLVGWLVVFL